MSLTKNPMVRLKDWQNSTFFACCKPTILPMAITSIGRSTNWPTQSHFREFSPRRRWPTTRKRPSTMPARAEPSETCCSQTSTGSTSYGRGATGCTGVMKEESQAATLLILLGQVVHKTHGLQVQLRPEL